MQNYVTSFSGHWSCPTGMSSFGFFQVFGTLDVAAQRKDLCYLTDPHIMAIHLRHIFRLLTLTWAFSGLQEGLASLVRQGLGFLPCFLELCSCRRSLGWPCRNLAWVREAWRRSRCGGDSSSSSGGDGWGDGTSSAVLSRGRGTIRLSRHRHGLQRRRDGPGLRDGGLGHAGSRQQRRDFPGLGFQVFTRGSSIGVRQPIDGLFRLGKGCWQALRWGLLWRGFFRLWAFRFWCDSFSGGGLSWWARGISWLHCWGRYGRSRGCSYTWGRLWAGGRKLSFLWGRGRLDWAAGISSL